MNEIQSLLDAAQSSLNSLQSLWTEASAWTGSLFNGTEAIGGILVAVVGAAILAGAAFVVKHFIDN